MTITITGTAGVSQCAPNSVSQDDIKDGVVGKGPAFSAFATANQAVSSGVTTKVVLQGEDFDTANAFDSGSTYQFQPQIAGYYQVQFTIRALSTGGTITTLYADIYKNGAALRRGNEISANGITQIQSNALVYLNGSTDYLEFMCTASGTGTLALSFFNNAFTSNASGFLVRAA